LLPFNRRGVALNLFDQASHLSGGLQLYHRRVLPPIGRATKSQEVADDSLSIPLGLRAGAVILFGHNSPSYCASRDDGID
jgi:hypothetical protein